MRVCVLACMRASGAGACRYVCAGVRVCSTLRASLSGTFLQTPPDLVTITTTTPIPRLFKTKNKNLLCSPLCQTSTVCTSCAACILFPIAIFNSGSAPAFCPTALKIQHQYLHTVALQSYGVLSTAGPKPPQRGRGRHFNQTQPLPNHSPFSLSHLSS